MEVSYRTLKKGTIKPPPGIEPLEKELYDWVGQVRGGAELFHDPELADIIARHRDERIVGLRKLGLRRDDSSAHRNTTIARAVAILSALGLAGWLGPEIWRAIPFVGSIGIGLIVAITAFYAWRIFHPVYATTPGRKALAETRLSRKSHTAPSRKKSRTRTRPRGKSRCMVWAASRATVPRPFAYCSMLRNAPGVNRLPLRPGSRRGSIR